MLRRTVLSCLVLLAGVAHAAGLPDPSAPRIFPLAARVVIGADGRVAQVEWLGTNPIEKQLQARVEPKLRAWEFAPGTFDGVAAETRTRLDVELSGVPSAEGGLAFAVASVRTGPMLKASPFPEFPPELLRERREALFTPELVINADGTTTLAGIAIDMSRGDDVAVRDSVTKAYSHWAYEPETVGGHAVAGHLFVPSSFCLKDSTWCERRKAEKAAQSGQPVVQDGQPYGFESAVKLKSDVAGAAI